jgi:hypothetical protein
MTKAVQRFAHSMPKNQDYIISLCDKVLGQESIKNKECLPFLLGHKSLKTGRRPKLRPDAFYPNLKLVIEYNESQHSESVPWWDNQIRACGCTRREQRKAYDQIRRRELRKHGLDLKVLDYSLFAHNSKKRLLRNQSTDEAIIRNELKKYILNTGNPKRRRKDFSAARKAR